ncbi:hypothetical protein KTR66_09970 [Roseococcus sp. SDR]|uniref:hypothetical protein n=1 Tax=Roseococcus sp. SDR TaxID=2835532 RepID=UPI001BCD36F0|nr:hypothetical protein [Roseococcus sp. SDR]MBS7790324.1 hypothetical protein [Roseococcus sp. SDR]MBV1845638.1 hypothetical protein [Roseococcus sp. SDR]
MAYVRRSTGGTAGPFIYPAEIHDCPGAERVFRVDGNAPQAARFPIDGRGIAAMATVVRQMEAGTFLRSESRRWPACGVPRQAMVRIDGFREAHAELRRVTAAATMP